jgi:hypothetical protein
MTSLRTTAKRAGRRLGFETFESRRLMAVTTSLSNGSLLIDGDGDADDIAIVGTANPGEITVMGRNGTQVDGLVNGSTTIQGVTANVVADFGDGDNIINVDNVYLAGNLELNTGNGRDQVTLGATGVVSTGGTCIVRTRDGNDVVRAEDYRVFIVGFLSVQAGVGQDSIALTGASSLVSINVEKSIGFCEVLMRGVTSAGTIGVHSLAPDNSIAIITSAASSQINVYTRSGQNSFYLDTNFAGSYIAVTANTNVPTAFGVPDHTVTIARCQTAQIYVQLGGAFQTLPGGDDYIQLYGNLIVGPPQFSFYAYPAAETSVIFIESGDGHDTVDVSYNVAHGNFFATLSGLDDTLSLAGNLMTGFASADGGDGTNRLNLFGNQFGGFAANRF